VRLSPTAKRGRVGAFFSDSPMIWRASADQLIRQLMEEDGGPLTWPPISETEQNAIYFTCRKLYRFLNHPTSAERPKSAHKFP